VNDTITIYNYGAYQVTSVQLFPNPPIVSSTNTSPVGNQALVVINPPCVDKSGTTTIGPYLGGVPPSIVFACNYAASLKGFGGFVTFTGAAEGMYNGFEVTSGEAVSNTIQIGGPVSPLNQGPFSANFFFFRSFWLFSVHHNPGFTNPSVPAPRGHTN
jgi:hypothetical protein